MNITELDFDAIKASLKNNFQNDPNFTDWDFEGSGLDSLLSLLAYNTQMNAINSHLTLNEAFLTSAQLRNNVVSRAKELGYVPTSKIASTVKVDVTVSGSGTGDPSTITCLRGTKFQTASSGVNYTFLATSDIISNSVNGSGEYVFEGLELKEGVLKSQTYTMDDNNFNQKLVIPDDDIDITTLMVRVNDPSESLVEEYQQYTSISTLDKDSLIYFIEENYEGRYEVSFGDNVLGKRPSNNSVVTLEYFYTNAELANGAKVFTAQEAIGGFGTAQDALVSLSNSNSSSYGGQDRETIESIRFNAPLSFVTQNRAVTADDYKTIILREFGEVDAINIWGGETATFPQYGRVYLSIKPKNSDFLSDAQKQEIQGILDGKNIITITPEFIDPDYTYLRIAAAFQYNLKLSNKTVSTLESEVRQAIIDYDANDLNRFDGVFRLSNLLSAIDRVDTGVISSYAKTYMFKDVVAQPSIFNQFDVSYTDSIYRTDRLAPIMLLAPFTFAGIDYYLRDEPIAGTFDRAIYRYNATSGRRSQAPFGRIYTREGRIVISNLQVDSETTIRLDVIPNTFDIAPQQNQLISIDIPSLALESTLDTISTSGSAGSNDYQTLERD